MADAPEELRRFYTDENRRAQERHELAIAKVKRDSAKATRSSTLSTLITAAVVIPLIFALWRWSLGL